MSEEKTVPKRGSAGPGGDRRAGTGARIVVGLALAVGAVAIAVADLAPEVVAVGASGGPVARPLLAVGGDTVAGLDATAPTGVGDWAGAVLLNAAFYSGLALLAISVVPQFRGEQQRRWSTAVAGAALLAGVLWLVAQLLIAGFAADDDFVLKLVGSLAWGQAVLTVLVLVVVLAGLASLLLPGRIRAVLTAVDVPRADQDKPANLELVGGPTKRLGLCFSGGGVRAAAITLGALQTLETEGDLGWGTASRVTAVSGGSYMAGGWSIARSAPTPPETDPAPPPFRLPEPWAFGDRPGPEEQHLIANLGYLLSTSPRGAGPADEDQTEATRRRHSARAPAVFATVLTGMIINGAVLYALLWALSQPLGWLYRWYFGQACNWPAGDLDYDARHACLVDTATWWPGVVWLVLGSASVLAWVLVAKLFEVRGIGLPAWVLVLKQAGYGGLAVGGLLALLLAAVPLLLAVLGRPGAATANLVTILGIAGSAGAVFRTLSSPLARFAPLIGGAIFALLLCYLALRAVLFGLSNEPAYIAWLVVVGGLLLVQILFSPEQWSLAAFYRSKLRLGFATYRTQGGRRARAYANGNRPRPELGWVPEPSLSTLATRDLDPVRGTPLTVCATATVSGRKVRTHHGVPALSVTFDPQRTTLHVPTGEPGTFLDQGASTASLEALMPKGGPRLTTMLAVGLSGAAVSPAMGRFRVGPVSMLLTVANVRLGMWLPNPRYVDELAPAGRRLPKPRLGYLLKEFFGIHDPTDLYLYVTDGGHWENTGLVELLRTSDCREIVCIDADAGPGNLASSISKAIDLAWLECQCRIVMDLDVLRSDAVVSPGRDYSLRSVNLGLVERDNLGQPSVSLLWYAKPAVTRDMPLPLLSYREVDPTFPRVSTVNQFFHVAQYSAYRDLGRYNAGQLLLARRALVTAATNCATYDGLVMASNVAGASWVLGELIRLIDDVARRSPADARAARRLEVYLQVREVLTGSLAED